MENLKKKEKKDLVNNTQSVCTASMIAEQWFVSFVVNE